MMGISMKKLVLFLMMLMGIVLGAKVLGAAAASSSAPAAAPAPAANVALFGDTEEGEDVIESLI